MARTLLAGSPDALLSQVLMVRQNIDILHSCEAVNFSEPRQELYPIRGQIVIPFCE
jgi:hypothetical protein